MAISGNMSYIYKYPDHYISYMLNERLHGKEQFCSKKYLLEMTPSHAKMHWKSAPEKSNFVKAKVT